MSSSNKEGKNICNLPVSVNNGLHMSDFLDLLVVCRFWITFTWNFPIEACLAVICYVDLSGVWTHGSAFLYLALLCYKMFKILLKHKQCHLSYEFFNSWVYFHWNFNFSKKIICGVSIIFLLSTSWITKWLELINIFILILAVFNRCLSFIFSFCSETSMGKGGQNNQRKVNHFPAYIFPVLVMNFVSNVLHHIICDIDV